MSIVPIIVATSASQYVRYKCKICHERVHIHNGRRSIPKCAVCNSKLCKKCNQYGLCPSHFRNLDEVDRKSVQSLYHRLKEAKSRIKSLFLIPLITALFLFAILIVGIYPTTTGFASSMIFWIIFIGLCLFAPIIVINIRIQNVRTLFRSDLINIFEKYQISGVERLFDPNRKYCPHYKLEFPNGTIYCAYCGEKL
jgi:hypothetical protein